MEHQVTLNIPDAVYQRAHQIAKKQGIQSENVLVKEIKDASYMCSMPDAFAFSDGL